MSSLPAPARLRRALDRPVVRFVLIAALALVAAVRTEGVVAGAERARRDWGRTTVVAVANRDLEPGTTIGPGDVDLMDRPEVVLADDAATAPVGRIVTEPIARSEVVLDRRLSNGGTGASAFLDPGSVAFAVPVDRSTPTLHAGDHVDVFAPVDTASRTAVGATRVARRAVVVSVSDRTVMIGVDIASSSAVARALLDSTVVLALAG